MRQQHPQQQIISKSHSYYAASSIASCNKNEYKTIEANAYTHTSLSEIENYKSLQNKKKRKF
jgi:hypothetical protein